MHERASRLQLMRKSLGCAKNPDRRQSESLPSLSESPRRSWSSSVSAISSASAKSMASLGVDSALRRSRPLSFSPRDDSHVLGLLFGVGFFVTVFLFFSALSLLSSSRASPRDLAALSLVTWAFALSFV